MAMASFYEGDPDDDQDLMPTAHAIPPPSTGQSSSQPPASQPAKTTSKRTTNSRSELLSVILMRSTLKRLLI